ncbi:MAG: metal-dependent hydrolase [Nitrospinae bacterium]|nr:metal-dependent hydrolase [Nitrospinota bacterium]
MDTLTHGLVGALVAQAGFRQRIGPAASWAITGGAVLPDIDFAMHLFDDFASLRYHRVLTHSLLGALLFALPLAAIWAIRWPSKRYGVLVGLSALGILLHIVTDVITPYGTVVLYPFSRTRFALDWVFILDGAFTGILLTSLLLGWRRKACGCFVARLGLGVLVLYISATGFAHSRALERLEQAAAQRHLTPVQMAAFPHPPSLFSWMGILETEDAFYEGHINLLSRQGISLQPFPKLVNDSVVEHLRAHEEVSLFLWFARFPWATYQPSPEGSVIEFIDLRFHTRVLRNPFRLQILLNDHGGVKRIGFNRRS